MSSCRFCEKDFVPRSAGGKPQVYCSAACRLLHYGFRYRKESRSPDLLPNPKGGRFTICEICGVDFTTRNRYGGRRQRYCSDACCRIGYSKRFPYKAWEHSLKKYNLTIADYLAMLEKQMHMCAICGRPAQNNNLHVDHNHETTRVRGLLCPPCNRHLGYFEKWGTRIIDYTNPEGWSSERSINREAESAT